MPIEPFPIAPITDDMILQDEPMGSKDKCWCQLTTELGGGRWLFKQPRQQPENIEHLAEKIAYELARLIQLPCARVELAQFGVVRGSISLDVRNPGEVLVHGNEIIAGHVLGYDLHQKRHTSDHTFERIRKGILEVCTGRCKEDLNQFAGYLAFDALIANTDRRLLLLRENRIPDYVRKGWGAVYLEALGESKISPIDLVIRLAPKMPESFGSWLKRIGNVTNEDVYSIVEQVPAGWMSSAQREFAVALICHSRDQLKALS